MSKSNNDYDIVFKVVLVGDSGVGKSNLLTRHMHNAFNTKPKATIGAEFEVKTYLTEDGKQRVQTYIWDTAGQEEHRALASLYYKNAAGAFLVYDISSRKSFINAEKWLDELKKNADSQLIIMLIGNKSDKPEREVPEEEAAEFAEKHGLAFAETSALNGGNVDVAFNRLFSNICRLLANEDSAQISSNFSKSFKLKADTPSELQDRKKAAKQCKC